MNVNVNSMIAHSDWMGNNAHNVANVNTECFDASRTLMSQDVGGNVMESTAMTGSKTDLSRELTEQVLIENGFDANASVIKTEDEMLGSVLDMLA